MELNLLILAIAIGLFTGFFEWINKKESSNAPMRALLKIVNSIFIVVVIVALAGTALYVGYSFIYDDKESCSKGFRGENLECE